MRVLYVCADPGIDVYGRKGAAVHVRAMCRALTDRGAEVVLACVRAEGPPPPGFAAYVGDAFNRARGAAAADHRVAPRPTSDEDAPGAAARLVRVACPPDAARTAGLLSLLRREPELPDALHQAARTLILQAGHAAMAQRIAAEWAPDVVYERYSLFADAGLAIARSAQVPHLLELNAPLVDEQARYRALALETTARTLEQGVLSGTDAVLAVSHPLAQWARRTIGAPGAARPHIAVVPNGVDGASFAQPADLGAMSAQRATVRRRLDLAQRQVIVFAGSLKPWHGTSHLVGAASSLVATHPSALVLIVGDGPERAALEAQALDSGAPVRFVGAVPHSDVPPILAASDIGVAPYGSEHQGPAGFYFSPLKVFEYMAAGLPVVASDVGDIGLTVTPGVTGVLFAPGDVDALAASLRRLLDDPAAARRMGDAARRHVLANHTWDLGAQRILGMADSLRAARAA